MIEEIEAVHVGGAVFDGVHADVPSGSAPEPYHLGGRARQIRRYDLRLGQPVNRERSIAVPGDKRSRTTDALRSDRIPHVRRYQANRGRRDIEFLGNHAIHLWRGLESAHAIDA